MFRVKLVGLRRSGPRGSASGSLGRNMHECLLEANLGMEDLVAQIEEQIKLTFGQWWTSSRCSPDGLSSCLVSVFRCFHPVFFHIQMLWELVLLGEALVVMAPSPAESSDTVLALVR